MTVCQLKALITKHEGDQSKSEWSVFLTCHRIVRWSRWLWHTNLMQRTLDIRQVWQQGGGSLWDATYMLAWLMKNACPTHPVARNVCFVEVLGQRSSDMSVKEWYWVNFTAWVSASAWHYWSPNHPSRMYHGFQRNRDDQFEDVISTHFPMAMWWRVWTPFSHSIDDTDGWLAIMGRSRSLTGQVLDEKRLGVETDEG